MCQGLVKFITLKYCQTVNPIWCPSELIKVPGMMFLEHNEYIYNETLCTRGDLVLGISRIVYFLHFYQDCNFKRVQAGSHQSYACVKVRQVLSEAAVQIMPVISRSVTSSPPGILHYL